MVGRSWKVAGAALALIVLGVVVAWATSQQAPFNPATFEDQPLEMRIAPLNDAVTLAQRRKADGSVSTILVLALDNERLQGIDLAQLGAENTADPFAALASVEADRLMPAALADAPIERFAVSELLPAAPGGDRHIGTGTNFPEHAEEAQSSAVFQFPKFGHASPARMTVAARAGTLLDYEVELCMRFDREVASAEDFDAAVKGLFLCGDFTDRAQLMRILRNGTLDDGRGFSDGKSRADFFPTGALLVIPRDWRRFVANERMTTAVNGQPRQDARGGEMKLDFRELAVKALGDMDRPRFLYRNAMFRLAPRHAITPDMALMSGTSEGVIFTGITRGEMIEGAVEWIVDGYWLRGRSVVDAIIDAVIEGRTKAGNFLQPGDVVRHGSSHMGDIMARVESPSDGT